jgi:ABC-type cobalamin/Fe3+-siderophores transport system ATPase subunit
MTNSFQFTIPRGSEDALTFTLGLGEILYIVGANGVGKSSLVSRLFNTHQNLAKRISAHRQMWFQSNSLDMTPQARESLETNIRSYDSQDTARFRLTYGNERASVAIYDLIDFDTIIARKIAELVRISDIDGAKREAIKPSPIQEINELMRLSNINIEISLEERQKVVAKKNGSAGYSVAELSDGERNAFLIAADVLTSKPGTLILVDEPERHLHRAIIAPLLRLLFNKRTDCAFIISTHEITLPIESPEANTLLVRGCQYAGSQVQSWTADMLMPGVIIAEDLKRDILGARRKLIFVEGVSRSLDAPLYGLLFPQTSVIPKDSCRDVEHAVKGLRNAEEMHWVKAWGIVDRDQREASEVERLKRDGVWVLSHYSVESLYYHPSIIAKVAARHAEIVGGDASALATAAVAGAVEAARLQREHLVGAAVLRDVRRQIFARIPAKSNVTTSDAIQLKVNVKALRDVEQARFDGLVSSASWDGLLAHYPLRESAAFARVVEGLQLRDRATYQAAVLKLLQDDQEALAEMRSLIGNDLYSEVAA